MCSVIAYSTENKNEKEIELLKQLIIQSKIRGLHSFGVSYLEQGKIITKKQFKLDVDELLKDFIKSSSTKLIYHNRYSTSGDYKDEKNNQPIQVENRALAMNGVLSMATKEEFEKEFNVKCESDNDTEIFLRNNKPIIDTLIENPNASFAGVYLDDKKFYALRNEKRPLYYFFFSNAKFVVSTKDIARRACFEEQINNIPIMTMLNLK